MFITINITQLLAINATLSAKILINRNILYDKVCLVWLRLESTYFHIEFAALTFLFYLQVFAHRKRSVWYATSFEDIISSYDRCKI